MDYAFQICIMRIELTGNVKGSNFEGSNFDLLLAMYGWFGVGGWGDGLGRNQRIHASTIQVDVKSYVKMRISADVSGFTCLGVVAGILKQKSS